MCVSSCWSKVRVSQSSLLFSFRVIYWQPSGYTIPRYRSLPDDRASVPDSSFPQLRRNFHFENETLPTRCDTELKARYSLVHGPEHLLQAKIQSYIEI